MMNQSSDAAEQIVRMSLEGVEVAAKVTGKGAKEISVLLYTVMKNKEQTSGKAKLSKMLKSGKPLTIFSVKSSDLAKFQEEAKRYGILYCALVDKKNKSNDGLVDIVVRKEDSARINRIVERFKFAEYNKADIISDIEKNRESVQKNESQKTKTDIVKEETVTKTKEKKSVNPNLAKTEKDPLSKPSSKMQKSSTRKGTLEINKKESVKVKLNEFKEKAKTDYEKRTKVNEKTPKIQNRKKSKEKIK